MIEIKTLGYPEVFRDHGRIPVPRKKSLALLVYLAVTRNKMDRDELRELLWPESSRSRGLAALRTVLADISSRIERALLVREKEAVFLNPALYRCDSCDFLRGIKQSGDIEALRRAENLWRTGFLKGFNLESSSRFDEWVFQQEQYFERLYRDLLRTLYYGYGEHGRLEEAAFYSRRALALDEYDEEALRALMICLALEGRKAEALSRYESFRLMMKQEMGYPLEGETEDIRAAVQRGNSGALVRYFPLKSRNFMERDPRTVLRKVAVSPGWERNLPDGFHLFTRALMDRLSDFSGLEIITRPLEPAEKRTQDDPKGLSPLWKADYLIDVRLGEEDDEPVIRTEFRDLAGDRVIGRFREAARYSREVVLSAGYASALVFADILRLPLHPVPRNRGTVRPLNDVSPLTVWKLKARQLLADFVPEKIETAHKIIDKALAAFPQDSETWSLKAYACLCQSGSGLFGGEVAELYRKSEEMTDQALARNPRDPTALWVRGMISRERYGNLEEAERYLLKAFSINPHDPSLLTSLSEVLSAQGRFRDALVMADRACDLDPLYYWAYTARYWASIGLRKYRLTAEIQDQITLLFGFPLLNEYSRGFLELLWGNYPRAVAIIEPLQERLKEEGLEPVLGLLAYAYVQTGREEDARRILQNLLEEKPSLLGYYLPLSAVYSALGEEETALNLLEKALEEKEPNLFLLVATPFYKPLEGCPRFLALLRKANLIGDRDHP